MISRFYLLTFILAIAFPALVLLFFVIKLALYSRRLKKHPSPKGLIGLTGRAQSAIANEGVVLVRGELWPARSAVTIQRGEPIFVKGFYGLALEVEPA
ncbi:MAG: NfeD family protein [Acidobacteria bacterium]|nr:NfeD family protein [Acidobacteriota bacterium]